MLTHESCLVWLDDIILHAPWLALRTIVCGIWSESRSLTEVASSQLSSASKRNKFLGNMISEKGIAMDPGKLDCMTSRPTSSKLKDVHVFVGLLSYFQSHIEDFTQISPSLHALTKKNVRFQWSTDWKIAFQILKERLTYAPIIALPKDECVITLDNDASNCSISTVFSQMQYGGERVITYGSQLYNQAESKYCTTRQELLAVVDFVKQCLQYLLGRLYIIQTGHAALKSLKERRSMWVSRAGSSFPLTISRSNIVPVKGILTLSPSVGFLASSADGRRIHQHVWSSITVLSSRLTFDGSRFIWHS